MSADVLRQAARLMRERAEAATAGPWTPLVDGIYVNPEFNDRGWLTYDAQIVDDPENEEPEASADMELIASWHPAVALAVADWLEDEAFMHDNGRPMSSAALTTATAYLGGDS